MNKQRNMSEKCCGCFSFSLGCLIIGLLEIIDIMFQFILLGTTFSSALLNLSSLKIGVDVLVAVLVIFGTLIKSRSCLWAWVIINALRVLAFPLFYCLYGYIALFVVERRQSPSDPIGFAIFYIGAAILIVISSIHAIFTYVVYGYIRLLRQQEDHKTMQVVHQWDVNPVPV